MSNKGLKHAPLRYLLEKQKRPLLKQGLMFFSSPPIFPAKPWCVAWNFRRGVRFDKGKRDAYRSKDDFSSGLNPLGGPYLPTQAFSEKKQKNQISFCARCHKRCAIGVCVKSPPRHDVFLLPPPKKISNIWGTVWCVRLQ